MKKSNKKITGAEKYAAKITIKEELNQYSGKILCPEKYEWATKVAKDIKLPIE